MNVVAKPDRKRCIREGCDVTVPRNRRDNFDTCSHGCDAVQRNMTEARYLCTATGDGKLWADAVAMSDALTTYREGETRAYVAAREAGITNGQWRAIKRGETRPDMEMPPP